MYFFGVICLKLLVHWEFHDRYLVMYLIYFLACWIMFVQPTYYGIHNFEWEPNWPDRDQIFKEKRNFSQQPSVANVSSARAETLAQFSPFLDLIWLELAVFCMLSQPFWIYTYPFLMVSRKQLFCSHFLSLALNSFQPLFCADHWALERGYII